MRKTGIDKDLLATALREWRESEAGGERLSEACRSRILGNFQGHAASRPLASLFLPSRGWALAGALPVALLTVVLCYGLWPAPLPEDGGTPMLRASRVGDEVVFEIANGGKPHRAFRSGSARETGEAIAVRDGRFRDRLDRAERLVFYSID